MRAELQEILQAYELKDIWNCDETALFWRLEPSKTIAHDPVLGKKHPKERVSILATCNASGDERLQEGMRRAFGKAKGLGARFKPCHVIFEA